MVQAGDAVTRDAGPRFGPGFPPESIAIVGISRNGGSTVPGYSGHQLFRGLRDYGYGGRLYPVNPKADRILGEKAYASVVDIPERLDLVIVTVPAQVVPQVIDDCAAAGARYVHICSSGFGETGLAQGEKLEAQVLDKATKSGIKIIGPNCMGFSVPSANITAFADIGIPPQGTLGFISQSGGHARTFMMNAPTMGLGFSMVVSYGNGLMLDAVAFTEYLARDEATKIICIYLEGIRQGRCFKEVVKNASSVKPVILWKGGLTTPGSRAASSHTGSMAGSHEIWRGLYQQTGAVSVESLEEMAEAAMAFHLLKPISGARAAVLTMGGGSTVEAGDMCGRENLDVPKFTPETAQALAGLVSTVNQGLSNPMDLPGLMNDPVGFPRVLRLIAADPNIDIILVGLPAQQIASGYGFIVQQIKAFNEEAPNSKQIVAAATDNWGLYETESQNRRLREWGVCAFSSVAGACRAINRLAAYYHHVGRAAGA